jgi:exodeoxyribonuclease V gamma subunit
MTVNGFNLFTGNRLESLAEALVESISEPPASPFAPEVIVLQSRGMERWLSMQIAQQKGVSANFSFPFPNTFLHNLYREIIPDIPEVSPFDTDILTFTIMKLLPGSLSLPGFESLAGYLDDKNDFLKLFQISKKLADLFEQYIIFRPEMIIKWEKGDEEIWQAQLWKKVVGEKNILHPARLREIMLKCLRDRSASTEKLPQRVSIFGISYLPEFHMHIFAALSHVIEINMYALNPCREYWGNILSDVEINRVKKKYVNTGKTTNELHLEKGNSLLASLGKQGRDFFEFINGIDCNIYEQFYESACTSMLGHIQNDILLMREKNFQEKQEYINLKNDKSIRIHSCHSPMREVEVLHDNLLDMFAENSNLVPNDIIVMAPDIELYAPYIQAVFDSRIDNRIPFSIADRNAAQESGVIDAFISILDLKESRFGINQVLDLLESPGIKRKFCPGKSDMEIIETWTRETNIRWGIDKESKVKLNLPAFSENTWKNGLDRLLLGYAMPGYKKKMFSGILPYDNIEGENVKVLGNFLDFCETLFSCAEGFNKNRTLSAWSIYLNNIIDEFFLLDDNDEFEIKVVRHILNDLQRIADITDFNKKISIDVIKSHIKGSLANKSFGSGFISGGVTFCSMLPMRSIPFKVICLIGMNHDAFPRDTQHLSFDLIAKQPKPLDRSRRNDDKYLFLEALISARDRLYISYIGQNIQDNSIIPPSVLVSELIDYMKKNFAAPGVTIENKVVVKHRLHAFSVDYFKNDADLFSYSRENYNAAKALYMMKKQNPPPFLSTRLAKSDNMPDDLINIEIKDLFDFFSHPVKYFLNKRFGIYLSEEIQVKDDKENFNLDSLDRYILESTLVKESLSGMNPDDYLPVQKAEGRLPHGNIGNYLYMQLSANALEFVEKIKKYTKTSRPDPVEFSLDIKGCNLYGKLDDVYEHGIIKSRYGSARSKDLLISWLSHLIFCALSASEKKKKSSCSSFLVCKDAVWEFSPPEQGRDILYELISIFSEGLFRPIKFFPKSSLEYAKKLLQKNKSPEAALHYARRIWTEDEYKKGEAENLYNSLCFGRSRISTESPLDEEFRALAETIFIPVFKCIKQI